MVDTTLTLSSASPSVVTQSFALQGALIDSVPTFVGSKQLMAILRNALNGKEGSRGVVVGASKKIATKTLFPVVMDLWKSIQNEPANVSFHLPSHRQHPHADQTDLVQLL